MEQKRTQLFAKRTGNRPETFAITVPLVRPSGGTI